MSSIRRGLSTVRNAWRYAYGKPKIYHPGKQKSGFRVLLDLLLYGIVKGEFFALYFAFGKNLEGSKCLESVIGPMEYLGLRDKIQALIMKSNADRMDYQAVTKNKFYARSILEANGIVAVPDIGLIRCGTLLHRDGTETGLWDFLRSSQRDCFIKNTILEAGEGVIRIGSHKGMWKLDNSAAAEVALLDRLGTSAWVLQERIDPHLILAQVKPDSLNTLRVVTVLDKETPRLLSGFISFGLGDSGIDSWAKGAVYVGIDLDSGTLKGFGYTSPNSALDGLIEKHPESLVKFDGIQIPYWEEAIQSCILGHKLFYNCFIIGWDLAITMDGPMILEVNEKPGMNVIQCLDKDLFTRFMDVCIRNIKHYG